MLFAICSQMFSRYDKLKLTIRIKIKKKHLGFRNLQVKLEKDLKRKLGFNEWDSNWDVGLHLKGKEIYLMLSKRNNLGSFQELEKVKYSKDLDADSWIMDCLVMYKSQLKK